MTRSSEKKRKSQKKSKNRSRKPEKSPLAIDVLPTEPRITVFEDEDHQWYIKEEAEKHDTPDEIRFIDSCADCQDPEVYELFNDGRKVVATVGGKVVSELEDTGGGLVYRDSDGKATRIELWMLSNLAISLQMMDAYHEGRIVGHDSHWWADYKGRVGVISNLLQTLKQERKHKMTVVNKEEW